MLTRFLAGRMGDMAYCLPSCKTLVYAGELGWGALGAGLCGKISDSLNFLLWVLRISLLHWGGNEGGITATGGQGLTPASATPTASFEASMKESSGQGV